ncbi:hypothetical protein [Antrihabitans spumae]|uniref:Uncharacterized protein n=1 Tax=Antrihabitans spumae TaxID=3373370 RepID=A0ABW7KC50_9NOCA
MFDVTIYTDVRPDEALDGVGGFNFAAASDGVTAADRSFVAERMLHVVSSGWHVDHEELAHPSSCIYRTSAGKYFLSRGKSTGKTITRPRPGNQLTETILTSERNDFLPYRPAQLFAANRWSVDKVSTKVLDSWPTPLEIDPAYEPDALKKQLIENSLLGPDFLPTFLTMIEQATSSPAKKLIIVHTSLETVMQYIALGSLFIDANRALDLSFHAFSNQPLSTVADIVGASPDFGATPSVHSGGAAFNVVDLISGEATPVEVTQSAAQQAKWFLEGDPVDALAAIDVARRWESVLGADVATQAAGIVSFGGAIGSSGAQDRSAALRAVAGLSSSEMSDDLAMYADELLGMIVSGPPADEADVRLTANAIVHAHRADLDDVATGILLPTLEALAASPGLVPAWATAVDAWPAGWPPVQWDSDESRVHGQATQVAVARQARAEDLPAVLIAAHKFNLLAGADITPCLDTLADYWCRHPELAQRRSELPYQSELGARITSRLVSALGREEDWAIGALTAGAWDSLGASSPSQLGGWISAVSVGRIPLNRRAGEIAAKGARLPIESWRLALDGADIPADVEVVAEWVAAHPRVPADLSAWIVKGLNKSRERVADGLSGGWLINRMLADRALPDDRGLQTIFDDTVAIRQIYRHAHESTARERNPAMHDIADRVGPYVAFLIPEVGNLMVRARDQRAVVRLERAVGEWAETCIDYALDGIATEEGDAKAVTWALSLYESGTDRQHAAGRDYLVALGDSRDGRHRLEAVRRVLNPSWLPVLDALLDDAKKGRLGRNLVRGGKRLFSKER